MHRPTLDDVAGRSDASRHVLAPKLVERDSTAPLRVVPTGKAPSRPRQRPKLTTDRPRQAIQRNPIFTSSYADDQLVGLDPLGGNT